MPFRVRSEGTVRLASADPFDHPLIDPQYFSDPADLATVVRTMSVQFKILESEYMAPYVHSHREQLPMPGCQFCPDKPVSECYSYLACVAQTHTWTTFHPIGSCRMGNATSVDAVVDERLRVKGIRNLRVIDASIMPKIPNSNTNAPTMMIGEYGAEMVKQDNGLI